MNFPAEKTSAAHSNNCYEVHYNAVCQKRLWRRAEVDFSGHVLGADMSAAKSVRDLRVTGSAATRTVDLLRGVEFVVWLSWFLTALCSGLVYCSKSGLFPVVRSN
jgi:hypothetical protein